MGDSAIMRLVGTGWRETRTSAFVVGLWVAGCGGDGGKITAVGVPSADLPPPTAPPSGLVPLSCTTTPTQDGVGTWRPISLDGAPSVAEYGVWTGTEVVVVNSQDPSDGPAPESISVYDPVLDSWRNIAIPSDVALSRSEPFLAVVGNKLLVYGGYASANSSRGPTYPVLTSGWSIDLQTGAWTSMAAGPPMNPGGIFYVQPVFASGTRALFIPFLPYGLPNGNTIAAATYDSSADQWATVAAPGSTTSFGCFYPGWNGQQAACNDADYLFLVTAEPLAIKPVPKLLDSAWGPYSIVFTPVGDLFFGLGLDLSAQGMAQVFWFDPAHENWSAPTPILGGLGLKITTINGRVIFWGEPNVGPTVFDPVAGTWSQVTCVGAPPIAPLGFEVPTNSGLIVVGGTQLPADNGVLEL
jgi:hypothetical protein